MISHGYPATKFGVRHVSSDRQVTTRGGESEPCDQLFEDSFLFCDGRSRTRQPTRHPCGLPAGSKSKKRIWQDRHGVATDKNEAGPLWQRRQADSRLRSAKSPIVQEFRASFTRIHRVSPPMHLNRGLAGAACLQPNPILEFFYRGSNPDRHGLNLFQTHSYYQYNLWLFGKSEPYGSLVNHRFQRIELHVWPSTPSFAPAVQSAVADCFPAVNGCALVASILRFASQEKCVRWSVHAAPAYSF